MNANIARRARAAVKFKWDFQTWKSGKHIVKRLFYCGPLLSGNFIRGASPHVFGEYASWPSSAVNEGRQLL